MASKEEYKQLIDAWKCEIRVLNWHRWYRTEFLHHGPTLTGRKSKVKIKKPEKEIYRKKREIHPCQTCVDFKDCPLKQGVEGWGCRHWKAEPPKSKEEKEKRKGAKWGLVISIVSAYKIARPFYERRIKQEWEKRLESIQQRLKWREDVLKSKAKLLGPAKRYVSRYRNSKGNIYIIEYPERRREFIKERNLKYIDNKAVIEEPGKRVVPREEIVRVQQEEKEYYFAIRNLAEVLFYMHGWTRRHWIYEEEEPRWGHRLKKTVKYWVNKLVDILAKKEEAPKSHNWRFRKYEGDATHLLLIKIIETMPKYNPLKSKPQTYFGDVLGHYVGELRRKKNRSRDAMLRSIRGEIRIKQKSVDEKGSEETTLFGAYVDKKKYDTRIGGIHKEVSIAEDAARKLDEIASKKLLYQRIIFLSEAGHTQKHIAKIVGISPVKINRILKEMQKS